MKPPPRSNSTTYEKVICGEFIKGTIDKIEYQDHTFKGFEGKPDTIAPAIRLVLKLDGYEWPHRSRWMRFSLGEKSNLYKKYVSKLVEDAKPDMDFDLDILIGMPIKTIWEQNGDFQNIELIAPLGKKKAITGVFEPPVVEENEDDESDFIPEIEEGDVPL